MHLVSRVSGSVFLAASVCLAAQAPPPRAHRDESEMMIFALMLENRTLADAVPGYPLPGGTWLVPFGEICRALSLGVRVQPRAGVAEGFIIQENRTFRLDVKTGVVELKGKRESFDRSRVEWRDEDLFVDTALLAQWLPLKCKVDTSTALITIQAVEPFPIQAQWARDAAFGKQKGGFGQQEAWKGPITPTPYTFLSLPFLDQSLSLSYQKGAQGAKGGLEASGSTYFSGDCLWMGGEGYFSSTKGDLFSRPRATLSRRDPRGGLLGSLHATVLSFGDNFVQAPELIGSAPTGRGIVIGNLPEQQQFNFDRRTFRGNLPPGWTVELYQNKNLVNAQRSRPDGLYEFPDIPLQYGVNDFRLVFYGPEGQHREETTRLDISRSQTPPGAFYYRMDVTRGALPESRSATGGDTQSQAPRPMVTQGQFETNYGFSKQLAVNAALSRVPDAGDQLQEFGVLGVQGFFPGFSTRLGYARDRAGGSARSLALGTGYGYSTLNLKRVELQDFASSEFKPTSGKLRARTTLQANLNTPAGFWLPLQFGLDEQRDDLEGGGQIQRTTARLSTFVKGTSISNSLIFSRSKDLPSPSKSTEGILLASKFMGSQSFRGTGSYSVEQGHPKFKQFGLAWDTSRFQPYYFGTGIERDVATKELTYSASLNRFEGRVGLSSQVNYSRSSGLNIGLSMQISIGREPRSGSWVVQSRPMAGSGAISATAYLDTNNNGARDSDEKLLEGAELSINGSRQANVLKDGPNIFSTYLTRDQVVKVGIASDSLEDPYMKPSRGDVLIVPRPGKVARLEFPLVVAGEITGTAYLKAPTGNLEFPSLALELVDGKGKVIASVSTAYDGFYNFTDVLPGDYMLRVAPGEASRLGIVLPPPKDLKITPTGTVFDGMNFIVESDGSVPFAPSKADPAPKESTPGAPSAPSAPPKPEAAPTEQGPSAPPEVSEVPKANEWTVLLVSAYEDATIQRARKALGAQGSKLFILPTDQPEGPKPLNKVCFGRFATEALARKALKGLPSHFFAGGNRPSVAQIPSGSTS